MFEVDLSWLDELQNQGKTNNYQQKERFIKWLEIPKEQGELVEIRLLPPSREIKNPIKFYQHWGITEKPFNCLQTWGEECPICKLIKDAVSFVYSSDLQPQQKKELSKEIYKYQSRYQYLFYALKVVDNKPMILNLYLVRFPKTIVEEKWGVMVKNGVIDLFSPETGVPVKIMRGNKELIRLEGNIPINIKNALDSIRDEIKPLPEVIYKPKQEEIVESLKILYNKIQKKLNVFGLEDYTPSPELLELISLDIDSNKEPQNDSTFKVNVQSNILANDNSTESKTIDIMPIGDLNFDSFEHKISFLNQTLFLNNIPDDIVVCIGNFGYSDKCNNCEYAEHCKSIIDIAKTEDARVIYEMSR